MFFLLKKIVAPFFYPLSLCLTVLIAGLVMLWFTKRKWTGKIMLSAGVFLIVAMSYPGLPEYLLGPLESRYPPLLRVGNLSDVKWVVVLGGGHSSDSGRPASAQLSKASLARVMEALRLHRALPGTRLILSGGAVYDPVSEAEVMAKTALDLGVDRRNMLLEAEAKDTEENVRRIQKIVGREPFLLVTSAGHMPRSMDLCKKIGLQPIPAPTDYLVRQEQAGKMPKRFFPDVDHLEMTERAFHEYLGLLWAKLRGQA